MTQQENPAEGFIRKRFETFQKLSAGKGAEEAMQTMFGDYAAQVKKQMQPYISRGTLYEGLSRAVAEFRRSGWDMDVVDISNNGLDAALEIQKVCPAKGLSREYGFDKPCFLVCDPDGPAIKESFPGLNAKTLCRQADGDCVCIFKFERRPLE